MSGYYLPTLRLFQPRHIRNMYVKTGASFWCYRTHLEEFAIYHYPYNDIPVLLSGIIKTLIDSPASISLQG